MDTFDIMMTATLRPDLIKKTLDSHIAFLFGSHINKARLFVNIDMVGESPPFEKLTEIENYLASLPVSLSMVHREHNVSFSRAFYRLLGHLDSPYTFNLEEDWELRRPVSFQRMVELMEEDPKLVHLRLSAFRSDGSGKLKTWNKFNKWNGKYYEIARDLRGTIGWCGHPSLNRTSFLLFFGSIMDPERNPEKQIKGAYPIILNSHFGVYHPNEVCPAAIYDLGRSWMVDNGFRKKGNKAHFTEWEKLS